MRDYGIEPVVWGGEPGCEHEWGEETKGKGITGGLGASELFMAGSGLTPETVRQKKIAQCHNGGVYNFCLHCGAWRGSLGLEPTIELFVEHIVEIFREVRRVLRPDGVCFVNLGDSYNGSGKASGRCWENGKIPNMSNKQGSNSGSLIGKAPLQLGLKPKDLCLIPSRVAIALQQPYYSGRIKSEQDRIWLAAIVDGEGSIFIHKQKIGKPTGRNPKNLRKTDSYDVGITVSNSSKSILEKCAAITGYSDVKEAKQHDSQRRLSYTWRISGHKARSVLREIYPFLVAKQHEARLMLGCPSSGELSEKTHEALKGLHQGQSTDIDFPAPASLYESGWYLRSDVIWNKKNPMPESVTDRPTRAHEYIFLLTKSGKYFWDQEAVREGREGDTHARGTKRNPPIESAGIGHKDWCKYMTDDDNLTSRNLRSVWTIPEEAVLLRWLLENHPEAANEMIQVFTTKEIRDVWTIATAPFPEAHFATFPPKLVETCIKAGTSPHGVCPKCGAPWVRVVEKKFYGDFRKGHRDKDKTEGSRHKLRFDKEIVTPKTLGFRPSCTCADNQPIPATVLDPFGGAGTAGLVAAKMGRNAILIELKPDYCDMAAKRIKGELGMLVNLCST